MTLATAERTWQALAWEVNARVAMADLAMAGALKTSSQKVYLRWKALKCRWPIGGFMERGGRALRTNRQQRSGTISSEAEPRHDHEPGEFPSRGGPAEKEFPFSAGDSQHPLWDDYRSRVDLSPFRVYQTTPYRPHGSIEAIQRKR